MYMLSVVHIEALTLEHVVDYQTRGLAWARCSTQKPVRRWGCHELTLARVWAEGLLKVDYKAVYAGLHLAAASTHASSSVGCPPLRRSP